MAYDRSVPGMRALSPHQLKILAACDRGEVTVPHRDGWRQAWLSRDGRCGVAVLSLARRDLVEIGKTADRWGRLPVQLTADGARVLKEAQADG